MKNILIIGAQGYIGSNLCSHFSAKGLHVWGCDTAGRNSSHFFRVKKNQPDFGSAFSSADFDVCINASGSGSVAFAEEHPAQDYILNVKNVEVLLNAIKKYQPSCRFINFSSAAVYGNPLRLPVKETQALKPISVYGKHKMQSELLCKKYFRESGLRTCNLRVFSVYGPGLKKQLFWDIYRLSLKKGTVMLSGTGRESRDFIFIDDLLYAIDIIISKSRFKADIINVGSGTETYIRNAASVLLGRLKKKFRLQFSGNARPADPDNWRADISKLKTMGFKAKTSLGEGLEQYARWLKQL